MYRTKTCGELNIKNVNETVELAGWIQKIRDLGAMIFIDLRDQFGITQIVINNEELQKQGITSLIIDLRNNGGGIVKEALEIADYILNKDDVILYEVDKNDKETVEKSTNDPIINMPIVVLTNGNTASSSEILAGALKDHGKATIIGEKTYGKGVIQQLLTLPDGSGLKITSEEYLTPNKTKINGIGIEPDEQISLPDTVKNVLNVEEKDDTQLQKAIEMLK